MAESQDRLRPWMIAAWPGMGSVAVIAAGYLIREMAMDATGELPQGDHFDIDEISVKSGLIEPSHLPRSLFFRWKNPGAGRDLVVMLGEAQPAAGTYAYARELIAAAAGMGVERIVTFASMASGLHPAASPKVTGVASTQEVLDELRRAEVEPMAEGQIGGLNGVVLAAAAEHGMPGFCLLAEIPFFAAAVPNPKAARAALSVFSVLSGIEISLEELNKHAAVVDRALIEALERLSAQRAGEEGEETEIIIPEPPAAPTQPAEATAGEPSLEPAAKKRIERLFTEARKDPGKAMALKQELDRLGVFKQYEDRFLDLFRRAG